LRCQEIRNLKLAHIDFERHKIHIVQSKGNKDRMVPFSTHLARLLKRYIVAAKPDTYLLNGIQKEDSTDTGYSQRGVQWVVTQTAKLAGIQKQVCTHTLRHTYACHLLEAGMNIVTLQELLGHQSIETTMEYLQLTQLDDRKVFSALDPLFASCRQNSR
jgi:integrase/recombinase XerD